MKNKIIALLLIMLLLETLALYVCAGVIEQYHHTVARHIEQIEAYNDRLSGIQDGLERIIGGE